MDDPDGFLKRVEYNFVDDWYCYMNDNVPWIALKEGEEPPRLPRYYYVEVDERGDEL